MAFWSRLLRENSIAWTDRTKKLIQTVLVLPTGSAEAERRFSILNVISNSKRTHRLTLDHMNDLMRIKFNTPDKIESFAVSKYASEWIRKNHKKTDDPIAKRPKTTDLSEEDEEIVDRKWLPKSTIF